MPKLSTLREKVENQASNISRACIYHTINIKIENVTKRAAHKDMAKETDTKRSCVFLVALVSILFVAAVFVVSGIPVANAMGIPAHAEMPEQPFADLTAQEVETGTGKAVKNGNSVKVRCNDHLQ